jgi:hypothetical protein
MSETSHKANTGKLQGPRMTASCFRGTLSDFLSEHKLLTQEGEVKA